MAVRSDEELAGEALAGSKEAAAELFRRHWAPSWRAAYAITASRAAADDVAQDAFQRAFRALLSFDGRRSFAAWLHRIVVNRALDLVRSERRLVGLGEDDEPAADPFEERLRDQELFTALAALEPERRAVVALRYWLDYSPAEIGDILALPVGTVSSRLSRALKGLREQLEGNRV
jgi:RNA polymerase sigma-70 factor (ECF subfamily)